MLISHACTTTPAMMNHCTLCTVLSTSDTHRTVQDSVLKMRGSTLCYPSSVLCSAHHNTHTHTHTHTHRTVCSGMRGATPCYPSSVLCSAHHTTHTHTHTQDSVLRDERSHTVLSFILGFKSLGIMKPKQTFLCPSAVRTNTLISKVKLLDSPKIRG